MKKILQQAKKLAIPSKKLQEEKTKIAKLAFELVRKQASKYQQITAVEFGGSYAKGTWLPQKADVDIFIKFVKSTPEKKFIDISKKIGFESMKKFHPYVRYSDHPYVEAKIWQTKVNVVPCYEIKDGMWQSAADRSPFHTRFMIESLTGTMKNEVRVLKNFLIGTSIYGAEIAKQGISGYVTEVLVLKYGTFRDVLTAIANLKANQIIGQPSKKFDTPIVIMDPVDSKRNLAAAISTENIAKFVLASRAFLNKPSPIFFKKVKWAGLKKNLENVVIVQFNYKPRSPDIIWGQIKRASNSLAIQMEKEGFEVLRNSAMTDEKKEAVLFFLMRSIKIEVDHVREGPDFFSKDDSEKFVKKNVKKSEIMWISDNRKILSLQKRQFNDASLFLKSLLKNHLNKSGIPKGLQRDFKEGFKVLEGKQVKSKSIKEALSDLVSTDAKLFYSN